ncbi:AfsR/SARP family transcriptional regulator [Nonomuraea wenchangensis]|uniref:DNA-binding transcriptional activator of the SARP family n=1 Tax=Nonomuraea wenchangensis TaxID=568860 RepID=A0A1I0AKV0_9ACTN|nr:AfsR/SARP family transcriptional regulator [Nonomuraea wenchangensis]SES94872.1 DNA-binding transcriptional activator of the SARP family [Nonomuraea wenchangensis]
MEIHLLGPLEVRHHGLVTPSAPKLRRVLCLLGIHANNVVSTEKLIKELWEEDPPASVTTTLQTYVYQLRKLLGLRASNGSSPGPDHDAGAPALLTTPNGYTLSLAPDALDAYRFEQLAALGQCHLKAGEVEKAADTLRDALRLWRGPALVDVTPGAVLQTEALRLEEVRKSILEHRIEADLQLGRHHELLGELTGLALREPTHEGFQAMLMLALYRAGRRSDALRVYQRTRMMLARELGVEPSNRLWRLHQDMLTSSRDLDPRPVSTTAKTRLTSASEHPCQLPPNGRILVGRDDELAMMLHALSACSREGPNVVVVSGPPGSGTTSLCIRAGHEVRDRYPDAQLYAGMLKDSDPANPGEVLASFLRALGVPDRRIPAAFEDRRRMFCAWAAEHQALIVLDDAMSVKQLMQVLPVEGPCGVLISGRRRMFLPGGVTVVDLPPLGTEDGLRLLTEVLGPERIAENPHAAADLVQLCDGLPSILHAAASRLASRPHWTIDHLVEQVRRTRSTGAFLVGAWSPLVTSVRRNYEVMPEALRTVFRRLCAIPSPFLPPVLVAAVLGVPEEFAEFLLQELANRQLLRIDFGMVPTTPERYWLLPTVRAIGRYLQAPLDEDLS